MKNWYCHRCEEVEVTSFDVEGITHRHGALYMLHQISNTEAALIRRTNFLKANPKDEEERKDKTA